MRRRTLTNPPGDEDSGDGSRNERDGHQRAGERIFSKRIPDGCLVAAFDDASDGDVGGNDQAGDEPDHSPEEAVNDPSSRSRVHGVSVAP